MNYIFISTLSSGASRGVILSRSGDIIRASLPSRFLSSFDIVQPTLSPAMESPTASSIRLESTEEGFSRSDTTIFGPRKQAGIKKIHFEVLLPATSVKWLKKLQSTAEAAANDATFTRAIAAFFRRLATWEPRSPSGGVRLTVTIRSPNLGLI